MCAIPTGVGNGAIAYPYPARRNFVPTLAPNYDPVTKIPLITGLELKTQVWARPPLDVEWPW